MPVQQRVRTSGRRQFIARAAQASAAASLAAWLPSRASALRGSSDVADNTLTLAWEAVPPSFDTQANPDPATTSFACAVMSGLLRFRLDPDPEVSARHALEPDLAASWEAPDASHWILHLRPDATFQSIPPVNGRPVESEDVRASFTRQAGIAQSQNRAVAAMFDAPAIDTPDPQTVIFRLPRPYAPLAQFLASVPEGLVFPREALAGAYDPAVQMIGSGPFYLGSYVGGVGETLRRNAGYFDQGLPYLDGVQQKINPDEASRRAQFTAGNLDVVRVGESSLATITAANPNAQVVKAISDRNYAIFFQLGPGPPLFLDARLRQAVSEAIDRDAIGQAIYAGQYQLAFGANLSMGSAALRSGDLNPRVQRAHTFDPADAAMLLRAAGYGYGQLDLTLAYPSGAFGAEFDTMAKMIGDMLAAVFGNVTLLPIDYTRDYLGGGSGYRYGNFPRDTLVLGSVYPYQTVDQYVVENYRAPHSPSTADTVQD
ncbi:MAG TPA: ABC transporter substrate-binding protein, partial [Dehalococcoidia bacterium]|nr:ABC transporter substrate-binding protein [Dehalococcoidia bacterium]